MDRKNIQEKATLSVSNPAKNWDFQFMLTRTLTFVSFYLATLGGFSQSTQEQIDCLSRRLDSLEARLNRNLPEDRSQIRNAIEG